MYIDTHTHLYLDAFRTDIGEVMQRASDAGVHAFYLPSIDRSVMEDLLGLERAYPGVCHAMAGLHPCSVKDDYEAELEEVLGWLGRRRFAAVGEIGLDFHWDLSFRDQQYDALHRQLEWAKEFSLPVVLHTRKATDECIQAVREHQDGRLKGVFHCFSGTVEQAAQVIELGFLMGIGGVVTYRNGGLEPVIRAHGLSHVVLETDAPYLSPVPYRGKRNEPAFLAHIAESLASITGMSVEEVAAATSLNAETLFSTRT